MTTLASEWSGEPSSVSTALHADDVHVWLVDLDGAAAWRPALTATLSPDERDRADRFHFERDRRRFACGRGVLRDVLAGYVGQPSSTLRFEYGAHGKPALSNEAADDLRFNVSHSGSLALVAVTRGRDVGVDIEAVRPMEDGEDIASRFFSPQEVAVLRSIAEPDRNDAFFACWTRKEAYLKALGDGLALPLDTFDVTFAPGERPRLRVEGDPGESERWSLRALSAPRGYAAAIVIERPVERVTCWTWTAPMSTGVEVVHESRRVG